MLDRLAIGAHIGFMGWLDISEFAHILGLLVKGNSVPLLLLQL